MTLKDVIKEKIDRFDSAPARFQTEVEMAQNQIYHKILDKLEGLEVGEGGVVLPTPNNLAMIKELGTELRSIITDPDSKYMKSVSNFIDEFSGQKKLTTSLFEKTFDEDINVKDFEPLYKNSVQTATKLVANSAVTEHVTAFEDMLQTSIGSGDTYSNIVKNISTLIQGNDKIDGTLSRYAKQNAKDIFAVADRQYSKAIADRLDTIFWKYSGGLIDTSRPFCEARNGKVFHKKEIQEWASLGPWDGRAAGTTSETIFSLCGGYNCDHVLIPVALKYAPIKDLQRNIDNGNLDYDDLPEDIQMKLAA